MSWSKVTRYVYVAISTGLGTPAVAAIGGVPAEHVSTIGLVAGTIAVVSAGIAWVDSRVEKAIKAHAEKDELRHEAVLAELKHLRRELQPHRVCSPEPEGEAEPC